MTNLGAGRTRRRYGGARAVAIVFILALASMGCASLPIGGQEMRSRYPMSGSGIGTLNASAAPLPPGTSRNERPRTPEDERRDALAAQLAVQGTVLDVSKSTRRMSSALSRLKTHGRGVGGGSGAFTHYVDEGTEQLRWINARLTAATHLAIAASEVDDPEMQLALLRMAGPRLESAMLGALLLAIWTDLLHLADAVLSQHLYSTEGMFKDLWHWRARLRPTLAALAAEEPGLREAAARDVPALAGHLSEEFTATLGTARRGTENVAKALAIKEAIEAISLLSALRLSLPSASPPTPALLGIGLSVGGDGVMVGTRMVVSLEWVETMRQLVRAGILTLPAVGAALRIQAGQVLLAQSHDELPQSVREALGEGPEVKAMRETGRAGAGMTEQPRHHVMPKEFREWFEKRGFTGEMDIDRFCVQLERAHHEAIHGGGNWRLGRTWPDEWNQMIMTVLRQAESKAGRTLPPGAILRLVAREMKRYKIPMNFVPGNRT